jgi:hypothetical protein
LVRAGVHFYAPIGFFVHASEDLVAITAGTGTMAKIQWPRASRVTDLFDGLSLEGKVTECVFATGQTRLFVREEIAGE